MRINKTFSLSLENDLFTKALKKQLPFFNTSKYVDDMITEQRLKWIKENEELAKEYNYFKVEYKKVEEENE